jgi:CDP-diacylglycerol--serine O-phosphatidyltransferase
MTENQAEVADSGSPAKPKKRRKALPVAPTLLTLAGAACGFGAITIAARVGPDLQIGLDGAGDQHLVFSALLIFAAIVFDALDGRVARMTKQTSEFGAQLDSLCDAISFGVAPAFLFLRSAPIYHDIYHPRFLWVVGLMFALCAVLRLARFNVTPKDQKSKAFSGLPSPAAAAVVTSFIFAACRAAGLEETGASEAHKLAGAWLSHAIELGFPLIVLCAACLMVSRFRYPHFGNQLVRGRLKFQTIVGLIFAIAAVFAVHELALPIFLCYYMLGAPVKYLWREATGMGKTREVGAPTAK